MTVKEDTTQREIETFGLESLKKHLKALTKSKNYFVELNDYHNISINFITKKYLKPIDIKENRNYTIIDHFASCNKHDYLTLLHSIIACSKVKNLRESNMPLNTFIEEVVSWVGMCESLIAYGYSLEKTEYLTNRSPYNLPSNIKTEVFYYIKSVITGIKYGVGEDNEGNSYNSITIKEVK